MEKTELPGRARLTAVLLIVFLFASGVFFWRLGANAISNADEGIHALVTRELRESNDWLTLHFKDLPYFRKPPLSFWTRAVTQNLFSENEFTSRLPSALAGLATTLLLTLWVWQVSRSHLAALAAGLIFPVLPSTFIHMFRSGEADGLLVFWSTLSAYLFWLSLRRPWILTAAAAAVGLAFMTKSVAAGVVPIAFGAALLVDRRWPYSLRQVLAALALFVLVVIPWHAAEHARHGSKFWGEYVGYHVIERVEERLHTTTQSHGPFWYAVALEQGMFPWSWLIVPALAMAFVRRAQQSRPDRSTETFFLAWGIGTVLLYSLAATKLSWYIAPAFPAMTYLLARLFTTGLKSIPRWIWILTGLSFGGYLIRAADLLTTGMARYVSLSFLPEPVIWVVAVVLVAVAVFLVRGQGQRAAKWLTMLVWAGLIHLALLSGVVLSRNIRSTYEHPFRVFRNEIVSRDLRQDVYMYPVGPLASPLSIIYLAGESEERRLKPLSQNLEALSFVIANEPGVFLIFNDQAPPPSFFLPKLELISSSAEYQIYRNR